MGYHCNFRQSGVRPRLSSLFRIGIAVCSVGLTPFLFGETVNKLQAVAAPNQSVFVVWEESISGESGFRLLRKAAGESDFSEVMTLPENAVSYTDTGLSNDTEYEYTVEPMGIDDASRATPVKASTFPPFEQNVNPQASIVPVDREDARFELETENGVSYVIDESTDLEDWTRVTGPLGGTGETFSVEFSPQSGPRFYRTLASTYERAKSIGLSVPFEEPVQEEGKVLDVTNFGSAPQVSGNDDGIGIATALEVAEPGDIVYLPEGRYDVSETFIVPTGVTLRGAGMDKTTLFTDGVEIAIAIQARSHDIVIEDFAIDHPEDKEVLQYGVYIGSARSGNNAYRIRVENMRIERFAKHGVSVRDAHHVLVKGCHILNATNLGGGGHGYGVVMNYPTNHDNWATGNTVGPVIRHAFLIQYEAHHNLVENNVAVENSEDAYDLHGEDENHNELRFNVAYGGDRDGFGVGNTGSTHDKAGPNNWIHHNEVYDSRAGLEVIQGSHNQFIEHNYFHENEYGIRVHNEGGAHIYIRNNRLENNDIGLQFLEGEWIIARDNIVSGSSTRPLWIHTEVTDYEITTNDFRNNSGTMLIDSDDGVFEDNNTDP